MRFLCWHLRPLFSHRPGHTIFHIFPSVVWVIGMFFQDCWTTILSLRSRPCISRILLFSISAHWCNLLIYSSWTLRPWSCLSVTLSYGFRFRGGTCLLPIFWVPPVSVPSSWSPGLPDLYIWPIYHLLMFLWRVVLTFGWQPVSRQSSCSRASSIRFGWWVARPTSSRFAAISSLFHCIPPSSVPWRFPYSF